MRRRVKSIKEVEEIWITVETAFEVIFNQRTSSLSFQKLFDIFHIITISKFGHLIHDKLENSFLKITHQIKDVLELEEDNLVNKFCEYFKRYFNLIDKVKKIAVYYDSRFVLNQPDGVPSSLIGYLTFREVFRKSGIVYRLTARLIEEIRKLRNDDYADKLILREAINCYIILGTDEAIFEESVISIKTFKLKNNKQFYRVYFEKDYIKSCVEFYKQEVQKIDFGNSSNIIQGITSLFEAELSLAENLLDFSSKQVVLETLDQKVIQAHGQKILENLPVVLDNNNKREFQDLLRLFFHSLTSRKLMYKKLQEYSIEKLQKISETKSDKEMVKKIIKFRKKIHGYLKIESYKSYRTIIKFIDDQLRVFIANEKLEKNIAKFFHLFITKIKWSSEQELEEFYVDISDIMALIYERTLFNIHYIKYLQKRLLNYEDSSSLIYENKVLDTLKLQGMQQFSSKADIPINDLRTSFLMNSQFESYYYTQINKGNISKVGPDIDLNFKVLTADFWDFKSDLNLHLPKQIQRMKALYERFFHTKFKQRKIIWKDEIGKVSLTMKNPGNGKRMELIMNTVQACVCMVFNKYPCLNFDDLSRLINISDAKLLETELKGLIYSKVLVTTGKEKVKDPLKKDSLFSINQKFNSKRNLVKIKAFKYVEKEKREESIMEEKYLISKKVKINSCLMKIMKSEKKMKFGDLMAKSTSLLSDFFVPTRRDLLKGLEELLNKEFLLRDDDDHNLIRYS